jgi:ABC-2 type transport system ATP-binding protein
VEQIQHQREQHRELTIRFLDRTEQAAEKLAGKEGVGKPLVDGHLLRFEFAGDLKDQAALIGWLVGEGFEIVEVAAHKKSLEDVFLQVTEGLVQ